MSNLKIGIVGAGIQGVCNALFLQKKGFQVTLFDREEPGSKAASYGNAGHFSPYASVPVNRPDILTDVPAMLLRSTVWWMSSIPAYNMTKTVVMHHMPTLNVNNDNDKKKTGESTYVHVIASFISGLTATTCSHPFDVMRVKLANQPVKNPIYNGMTDCFVKKVRKEGIIGLYKGIDDF